MFKVGEVIYCIDNKETEYKCKYGTKGGLYFDVPYKIYANKTNNVIIMLNGEENFFMKDRFITEREYNVSKRLKKLKKIKECLK